MGFVLARSLKDELGRIPPGPPFVFGRPLSGPVRPLTKLHPSGTRGHKGVLTALCTLVGTCINYKLHRFERDAGGLRRTPSEMGGGPAGPRSGRPKTNGGPIHFQLRSSLSERASTNPKMQDVCE